jgi:hypothetical protein
MKWLSCFSSIGKVSGSPQNKQSVSKHLVKKQPLFENTEKNKLEMSNANIRTRPLEEGDYNKGKRKTRDHIFTAQSFNQLRANLTKIRSFLHCRVLRSFIAVDRSW